jgi:hypothetical protein
MPVASSDFCISTANNPGFAQEVVFQSALSGRLTIAQQFTAGINGREDVVREADD